MFSELLLCFLILFNFFRFAFAFVILFSESGFFCTSRTPWTSERKSFGSVRDFRAQSANHLIMVGTSERESFGSVWDFRAQSACVCMYIYCMRYQKGQICLLKHVSKYI